MHVYNTTSYQVFIFTGTRVCKSDFRWSTIQMTANFWRPSVHTWSDLKQPRASHLGPQTIPSLAIMRSQTLLFAHNGSNSHLWNHILSTIRHSGMIIKQCLTGLAGWLPNVQEWCTVLWSVCDNLWHDQKSRVGILSTLDCPMTTVCSVTKNRRYWPPCVDVVQMRKHC